jgi:hypothetical protein
MPEMACIERLAPRAGYGSFGRRRNVVRARIWRGGSLKDDVIEGALAVEVREGGLCAFVAAT